MHLAYAIEKCKGLKLHSPHNPTPLKPRAQKSLNHELTHGCEASASCSHRRRMRGRRRPKGSSVTPGTASLKPSDWRLGDWFLYLAFGFRYTNKQMNVKRTNIFPHAYTMHVHKHHIHIRISIHTHLQAARQTDRSTDRQADGQTDTQKDSERDRENDKETERQRATSREGERERERQTDGLTARTGRQFCRQAGVQAG